MPFAGTGGHIQRHITWVPSPVAGLGAGGLCAPAGTSALAVPKARDKPAQARNAGEEGSFRSGHSGAADAAPPTMSTIHVTRRGFNQMHRLMRAALGGALVLALSASSAMAATVLTVNFANAPTGTHFVTGTATPTCTTSGLVVSCNSYELAGVGGTNATATLDASFSATVQCRNHGGSIVEVHSQTTSVSSTTGQIEPRNGRLRVPSLSSAPAPSAGQFEALATCPNPNWTPEVLGSSITLSSFTYKVTFAGQTAAAITITGP
jgi:hypothetical protein